MSQLEKLIEKLRATNTDVRFSDLEKVLSHYGYANVRHKGSHVHFRKQSAPFITVPVHSGKVKNVYVKEIMKLITL